MKNFILSDSERRFLTICLKCCNSNLTVSWSNLYKDGKLGQGQIHDITQKFRRLGFINKNGYDINKKRVEEIKHILEYNKKRDEDSHKVWDEFIKIFPTILVIFIVSFLVFCIGTTPSGCETKMARSVGNYSIDKFYIKTPYAGCYAIPIEYSEYDNRTLYEDENCMIPYFEGKRDLDY